MKLSALSTMMTCVAVAGTVGLSAQSPRPPKPLECGPNVAAASIEARQAAIAGATSAFLPRLELARCLDLAWRLQDVPSAISDAIVTLRGEEDRPAPVPAPPEPLLAGTDIPTPARVRFERPKYPDRAMDDGIAGLVIVDATIDKTGIVRVTQVAKSVPPLDRAATDAVKRWKFAPSMANGVPVEVRVYLPVKFGQTSELWASDFLDLSRFYYERGLRRHADATLTVALDTARKDAARFGPIIEMDEKTAPAGSKWPTVLREMKPKYTPAAMKAKVEGKVEMRILIDRSGSVARVRIVEFLDLLNVAAEQAAFQWKFSAARQDGEPVSAIVTLVLEFRLR